MCQQGLRPVQITQDKSEKIHSRKGFTILWTWHQLIKCRSCLRPDCDRGAMYVKLTIPDPWLGLLALLYLL